jgi:hypothetical protein
VDLLAPHDPVFVIDLTADTMRSCARDFGGGAPDSEEGAGGGAPPDSPRHPVRAIALVFAWEEDPVLLPLRPSVDARILDATARLIRTALLTGQTVAGVATELGDETVRRLYFSRKLPRFIYEGVPAPVRHRIPAEVHGVLGHRHKGRRPI